MTAVAIRNNNVLATDANMGLILAALQGADDIAIDTETSGLEVRSKRDYLMGICFDVPGLACYIPFRHKDYNVDKKWLPLIWGIIRTKPLIWFNRKFDMHALYTIGLDPLELQGPHYDGLMLATLNDENLFSKELDFLCKKYLKVNKFEKDAVHKYAQAVGYANVPAEMYKDYGSQDATLHRRLRDFLWPRIVAQELDTVYWETESPFTTLLYKLERRGVGRNAEFCERKVERGTSRMATIQRQLHLNPSSPIDLGQYLLDELELPILKHTKACDLCKEGHGVDTHEGRASFDKKAMEDYEIILEQSNNPAAQLILEYRGWQKAVSALYKPMLEKAGPDGRIRTSFNQHVAVTARLSSSDPNLQQVPRHTSKPWNGDAKSGFTAWLDDYCIYGWDWSQIELRLGAAYGPEPILLAEFEKADADPFAVLAPLIFGSFSEENRYKTKNQLVYPSLYGAQLKKIALTLSMPIHQAKPLYDNYKASIPNMTKRSYQVQRLAESRGYIRYWDGRRRHFPYRSEAYKAWNSLLQGGSAQLMKKSMLRCAEWENEECFMVLTVHDEICFMVRRDLISKYHPLVKQAMCDWPIFKVNLAIEGKEWK